MFDTKRIYQPRGILVTESEKELIQTIYNKLDIQNDDFNPNHFNDNEYIDCFYKYENVDKCFKNKRNRNIIKKINNIKNPSNKDKERRSIALSGLAHIKSK